MKITKPKSHKGAHKRFTLKAKGSLISHRSTNRSHINTKMSANRKRRLSKNTSLSKADYHKIKSIIT